MSTKKKLNEPKGNMKEKLRKDLFESVQDRLTTCNKNWSLISSIIDNIESIKDRSGKKVYVFDDYENFDDDIIDLNFKDVATGNIFFSVSVTIEYVED